MSSSDEKLVADACLRNQEPIAETLRQYLDGGRAWRVIEIGSGSGQHALYMANKFPKLFWLPTDLPQFLPSIRAWARDSQHQNIEPPVALDVNQTSHELQGEHFSAAFTANTIHFVSEQTACRLINCVADLMAPEALFFVYGPFNENGEFTSEGNRQLDAWLKSRDPLSGIRDLDWVTRRAADVGLQFLRKHAMPANNSLLVFSKS